MEGTDWYQSLARGTAQWIDGNQEPAGYKHLGETAKIIGADGDQSNGVNLNADGSATNIQTGKNATVSVSGNTQIVTKSEVDGGGAANATIAEVTLGALTVSLVLVCLI